MTLHRRLILAISLLLVLLLAATMVVTIYSARQNIYLQLQVHAQDTATSLGLSISQAAQAQDLVQVSSMIDVIFDGGYYRRIVYRDIEGQEVFRRELPLKVAEVPQWFVQWLTLPEPSGEAVVTSGWYQLGTITVVSHPGYAYKDLWRVFKDQLWLFIFASVLCYGLLGVGLNYLLRPLRQVEAQAEAITRREFTLLEPLPSIPELRRVVFAMNRMVEKVKVMFGHQLEMIDRLHQQLRTDPITGLSNRQDFDERVSAYLKSERKADHGALLLMQIGDLQLINREQGRKRGDDYLCVVAQCLQRHLTKFNDVLFSRHSGADFAVFIPAIDSPESQALLTQLQAELQATEWNGEPLQQVFMGMVYIASAADQWTTAQLLTAADDALNRAHHIESGCCWQSLSDDTDKPWRTASEWAELLQTGFNQQRFQFLYQPVWVAQHDQRHLLFNELLTGLTVNDQLCSASEFLPAAMRLQLMPLFDRQVLSALFRQRESIPECLCINISAAAVIDPLFMSQLREQLIDNPQLSSRLVFELPATSLSHSETAVREFASLVTSYGAKLSLHHFGRGTSEFAYLQSLPLDYLKIDRCFIQSIVDDKDAQFFVRSLVTIAHSCDIMVLAEGVETEAQWQQLLMLGVQGGQGYWLGRPQIEPVVG